MATENRSLIPVSIRYGVFVAIAYIVYTLLMQAIGLADIVELRFLNGIFLVIGICMAIRQHKIDKKGMLNYFEGFGIGLVVGAVSSLIFGIVMVILVKFIDNSFLETLRTTDYFGPNLSEWMLFMSIMITGIWPGIWIAFIAMQWFKRPDHKLTS